MAEEPSDAPVRWGRILGILFLFFLALEGGSQLFIYRWAGTRYQSLSPYVWSPYGLVRNNPKLTSVAFQISPNGFRNLQTFTQKKPPNTLRVFVLGGSVMYSGLGGTTIEGVERVDSSSTVAQYLDEELRKDPELAGINVEVMNAAVNFNMIVQVSAGYIAEYAYWEPDIVIVGGSGNNFCYYPPEGAIEARTFALQGGHGWEPDFQRIANSKTFIALADKGLNVLENYFASVALGRKALTKGMDSAPVFIEGKAISLGIREARVTPQPPADSLKEYDRYVNEYLGYAAAMAAVAKRHDQHMAFFWEYLLGHLGELKPMSALEKVLYERNRRSTYKTDRVYDLYARDKVGAFCKENGLTFLDPLESLSTYDGTVFIDYLHYTREGNQFMARFMYGALKDVIHERARRLRGERKP